MPMLAQILRDMKPHAPEPLSCVLVWSGALERAGACPSLLDWSGDPRNLYVSDSLHRAQTMVFVNRGLVER